MATEPGLHAMVLTRQAEACVGSERCYDVHGRDIYVYEVRWYNVRADLKLPESWVHSIGFTVDTHPLDPGDEASVEYLNHLYIGHDEDCAISIAVDRFGVPPTPTPALKQKIDALVSARLNNYHVFIDRLIKLMVETTNDDFEVETATDVRMLQLGYGK